MGQEKGLNKWKSHKFLNFVDMDDGLHKNEHTSRFSWNSSGLKALSWRSSQSTKKSRLGIQSNLHA